MESTSLGPLQAHFKYLSKSNDYYLPPLLLYLPLFPPKIPPHPNSLENPLTTFAPKKAIPPSLSPPSSPSSHLSKKRPCISDDPIPSKKGPGAYPDHENSPGQSQSISMVFTLGAIEKLPARSMFKAARKGKNIPKLTSVAVAAEFDSFEGGLYQASPKSMKILS